ncbi:hypothetical protein [Micromonospora sp. BL1]|uniref:hypothetical protein n=1 Tax=Micromonospora sp. BL1 TaxID=2478709 RepID=UPI000EF5BCD8|nr:hypothetical protein [Micromonospora sp. BL1]
MTDAPWWGTALLAGLFGLGGVAVAQVVAIRLEGVRNRREDQRRWHTERRHVYASFLAAAYAVYRHIRSSPRDEAYALRWRELTDDLTVRHQEVHLLASTPVTAAAQALLAQLREFAEATKRQPDGNHEALRDSLSQARMRFISLVRAELDVAEPGGSFTFRNF